MVFEHKSCGNHSSGSDNHVSTKWLVGLAESRDDSHPGWDGVGWLKISSPRRMAHNLKLELFVSGIFIYYFWTSLGCSLQELQKRKQRLCRDYRNGNRGYSGTTVVSEECIILHILRHLRKSGCISTTLTSIELGAAVTCL